ncbi:O-antigen ligase family protein [Shewanella sp. ENK2]|uniref:O-antigen ligase family protein n=1 Tax=Shewanella sp. ENK2 TaxID=2775245 RepID=UPI003748767A
MSKNPFFSGIELIYNGLLLIYFAFFVICMRALEKNKLYFGVYLYFLFFSIFTFVKYLLFLVFFYFDAKSFNIHELVYGYVNVRFFNQLQVMIIPILFWPFFHPECKRYKLASIIIISLHWVVLLQSEARGAALSLIISTGVLGYFLPSEKRFKLFFTSVKAFLFGGVLWLILIIIIPNWLMNVENLQLRTGSSGRIDLWFYSVKSIVDNIWFGFGPMSFAWAEGKPLYNAHPHNSVIQLLYEYGVVTWSVIVFGVFYFLRGKIQGLKCEYFQKTTPFLLSIFSGLIYSLFSGVIVMPFSQILLVFLVALVCHEGGLDITR